MRFESFAGTTGGSIQAFCISLTKREAQGKEVHIGLKAARRQTKKDVIFYYMDTKIHFHNCAFDYFSV